MQGIDASSWTVSDLRRNVEKYEFPLHEIDANFQKKKTSRTVQMRDKKYSSNVKDHEISDAESLNSDSDIQSEGMCSVSTYANTQQESFIEGVLETNKELDQEESLTETAVRLLQQAMEKRKQADDLEIKAISLLQQSTVVNVTQEFLPNKSVPKFSKKENKHVCLFCFAKFSSRSGADSHIRKTHTNNPLSCKVCNLKTFSVDYHRVHMKKCKSKNYPTPADADADCDQIQGQKEASLTPKMNNM